MKDLSYIVVSKNDSYDPDNLNKLILTVNNNVNQMIDLKLDVETILVDWCSTVPFNTLDRIKNELKNPVKHVYVDKSVLIADGLNPERFYEFFAKNVGVRQSSNRYVLVENSDIINDEELAASVAKMINDNMSGVYGRPTLRVNVWYPNIDEYTHYDTIEDKPYGDLNPGDFLITTREDWINKAQGYDETNQSHRGKGWQMNMDVEILLQMVLKGMKPHFLPGYYRHMDHGRTDLSFAEKYGNSTRNVNGYVNRPNWGYTDMDMKVENGVTILYKK